ncbi:hypothetical protein [Aliidiomarina haloalkalitolerans]|uniref:Uncharacterized protein n=1 Tax=Aliidiomarina haloalkalitolerans TaxID=859059 RepID=A0A432VRK0_9GAMM|nr:hypothetical protein [Aliidiomarina haloalkalitolerans]RUO18913.1 hypothetical protein CWE06_09985 [Aliidiomarina haloalkalitolerans]
MNPETYVLTVFIGVVTGSILGFVSNFTMEQIKESNKKKFNLKIELRNTLIEIMDDSILYWSAKKMDKTERLILGKKIRTMLMHQNNCIDKFLSIACANSSTSDRMTLSNFKVESFEAITGGNFEGNVKSDLSRSRRIASIYTKARILVNKYYF